MSAITAKHRIITDQCRKRGTEEVVAETVQSIEAALRAALDGWPAGDGTEIHAKVEIVRASADPGRPVPPHGSGP